MAGPLKQPNTFAIYNVLGEEVFCVENIIAVRDSTYDITSGKHIQYDENDNPDTLEYEWESVGMESGIYFYKIETMDTSVVKKMVLLK